VAIIKPLKAPPISANPSIYATVAKKAPLARRDNTGYCTEVADAKNNTRRVWVSKSITNDPELGKDRAGLLVRYDKIMNPVIEFCSTCKYRLFREFGGNCRDLKYVAFSASEE